MTPSLFSAVGQRLHDQRAGPGHAVLPGCRIRETAQNSQIIELEQLPAGPASTAAAMRRICAASPASTLRDPEFATKPPAFMPAGVAYALDPATQPLYPSAAHPAHAALYAEEWVGCHNH